MPRRYRLDIEISRYVDIDIDVDIQAGFRGMKIREARAKEEREVQQETVKQGRAIENHLGIDLADPQVSSVSF